MKKIAILLALACLLTALCGCGGKKELDPQALADELLNNASFTDDLDRLEDNVIPIYYGIEEKDYTSALAYAGAGGVTAEEIAVFAASDAAAADRILATLQTRLTDRVESFKTYFPAAVPTLEKAILKKKDNTVVLVICSDSDSAVKILGAYI